MVIGFAGTALAGELVCRLLPVGSGLEITPVNAADPIRHFAPNRTFVYSNDWRFSTINRGRTNNFGFVNNQDYDSSAISPLLAVIGDSYVEALSVMYDSTVQGRLASLVGSSGRVYSFGASGGALSQYLATASEVVRRYHPSGLAFIVVGNDFDESLRAYANAPGLHVLVDSSGTLALRRNDYRVASARGLIRSSALGRYLAWNLRPAIVILWNKIRGLESGTASVGNTSASADSARVRASRRAVDYVLDQLPRRTGLPAGRMLFLVDGKRPQLYSDSVLYTARQSYFELMRSYFWEAARLRGYEVVDLEPRFIVKYRSNGTRFETLVDGHWNASGHAVASVAISESRVFGRIFHTQAK
jgi:hypothetical protein